MSVESLWDANQQGMLDYRTLNCHKKPKSLRLKWVTVVLGSAFKHRRWLEVSQCVGNEARVLVELVKHREVSWQIPLWKGNMDQKNNLLVGDVGESPKVQKMVRFFQDD